MQDRDSPHRSADAPDALAQGDARYQDGDYAQAAQHYCRHLDKADEDGATHHKLAKSLFYLGMVDRAVEHWRSAIRLGEGLDPRLSLAVVAPGCPSIDPAGILEIRRDFGALLAAHMPQVALRTARQSASRRRRLGYVSAFFDKPNYMKPVWPLINHHDRERFEVHLFSDKPAGAFPGYRPRGDDRIHETDPLDNTQLAERARELDIDLLVDLNGYSRPRRIALFANQPAPVTLGWFNMYATSGLGGVQYIVGDDEVVSPAEEALFSETVLRLPQSYLSYRVDYPVPEVGPSPGLMGDGVTFGSLVSQYKITPFVLDAWAEILRRVEGSRLLLHNDTLGVEGNRRYIEDAFAERGVDPARLDLRGLAPHFAFLGSYAAVDVALDAFPYSGGTTTMEALWQGVPVVTFRGDRWAARTSASILRSTHLSELIADDLEGYVALAARLAEPAALPRLAELRTTMRERLLASKAFDAAGMTAAMERLYLEAWAAEQAD